MWFLGWDDVVMQWKMLGGDEESLTKAAEGLSAAYDGGREN